jgi:hypothetical protein
LIAAANAVMPGPEPLSGYGELANRAPTGNEISKTEPLEFDLAILNLPR